MPNLPLELIGTAEVARRRGCDTSTVHRLVNSGQLTAVAKAPGLRGAYLFDPAAVEAELQRPVDKADASAGSSAA